MTRSNLTRAAALTLAALALVAPTAGAHTLSKYRAVNAAYRALERHAAANERWFEYVSDVRRPACYRFTVHRFECVGSYDYETLPDWEYEDGTTAMFCNANIRVRYVSRWSFRVVAGVYGEECF